MNFLKVHHRIRFEFLIPYVLIAEVKEVLLKNLCLYNFATWTLAGLFIILLFYVFERCLFLHGGKVKPQQFLNGVISLLKNNRYNEALTVCEDSPGLVPLIVKTMIVLRNKPHDEVVFNATNVALLEVPLLERRLNSIKLIAKISPLVSFVGVLQMLGKVLAAIKYTASYFSASEALEFLQHAMFLIALGITINIVGTLAYSFLRGRVYRLVHDMEWACNEIMKFISTEKHI